MLYLKYNLGFQRYGYKFFTLLHYPNNLLLSASTAKYDWVQRQDTATFSMRFKVESMDLLNKRNKYNDPCKEDWKDYDIIEEQVKLAGCRVAYQNKIDQFPLCTSKEKVQEAREYSLSSGKANQGTPPCRVAEKIMFSYEEVEGKGTDWEGFGEFWVSLYFYSTTFKEITQTR